MWNELNCTVVWTFFGFAFLSDWNENWPFSVLWPLLSFPNSLAFDCNTLTASSYRIWNSSAVIPSLTLALFIVQFRPVQLLSCVRLFTTPWTAESQAFLSITNSQSLLKLMSIASVMPSNHLIFCWPLLLPPSIFPSIRVFSNESALGIRKPKYWSFSFSISLSNEYSGLISFGMNCLDLLEVQGTLKSLLLHHSSKASILRCSAFL